MQTNTVKIISERSWLEMNIVITDSLCLHLKLTQHCQIAIHPPPKQEKETGHSHGDKGSLPRGHVNREAGRLRIHHLNPVIKPGSIIMGWPDSLCLLMRSRMRNTASTMTQSY